MSIVTQYCVSIRTQIVFSLLPHDLSGFEIVARSSRKPDGKLVMGVHSIPSGKPADAGQRPAWCRKKPSFCLDKSFPMVMSEFMSTSILNIDFSYDFTIMKSRTLFTFSLTRKASKGGDMPIALSQVVSVALALVVVYYVLGLIVSAITKYALEVLETRGRSLENFLKDHLIGAIGEGKALSIEKLKSMPQLDTLKPVRYVKKELGFSPAKQRSRISSKKFRPRIWSMPSSIWPKRRRRQKMTFKNSLLYYPIHYLQVIKSSRSRKSSPRW